MTVTATRVAVFNLNSPALKISKFVVFNFIV